MLDHGLAADVRQWFPGKSCRMIARWYDADYFHRCASCYGYFLVTKKDPRIQVIVFSDYLGNSAAGQQPAAFCAADLISYGSLQVPPHGSPVQQDQPEPHGRLTPVQPQYK